MKKKLGMIVLTLAAVVVILAVSNVITKEQIVYINEVRSWDTAGVHGGYFGSDYIELYNASDEEIPLNGWYISDDARDLKKCQIYDVSIGAKGFTLLYANEKNDTGDSLNFKLNPAGEKIYLSDAQGYLVDSVYVPEQEFGTVYARKTDGADEWCVKEETTDYSNNDAKILPVRSLAEPVFSHESGFYEEAFTLNLEAENGETIYYTLDGSEPTEESSVYSEGILIENISDQPNVCGAVKNVVQEWLEHEPSDDPVDKAVIVRAVAMNENNEASEVVTHTYFVDEVKYQDKNVVSIVADFEDLFGNDGIFVTGDGYDKYYLSDGAVDWVAPNFLQSGRRWEVEGNMQILQNGLEILNQGVGIRTQGASTRLAAKKKMSIFSREEYSGSSYFEGLILGENQIHSVYTNHSISNIVFPELLKDRNLAIQNPMECVVFLNGEYWYDTYLLEKYNKYYLEETYQVNPDNVIIIKDQVATEGPEDAYAYYDSIRGSAAMNDMSIPEEYERFLEKIDIQSYIDYICANVYLCNMDMSETKNMMLWRTIEDEGTEFGDCRWRFMIYDVDCIEWMNWSYYDASDKAEVNSFTEVMQFTGISIDEHKIYASCKKNEEFAKQFVLSFMDMANVNFSVENVEKAFAKWNTELDGDLRYFFEHRFEHIAPYMAEQFNLTGTLEDVTLKVNETAGGTIQLNTTMPDLSEGSWTGKYYTDYPVTVNAVPADGYEFVGWSGSVTSNSDTIEAEVVEGGITLEAIFGKIAD